MDSNYDYTIEELLEEAKNDPGWELDAEKRTTLVDLLQTFLDRA